MATSTKKVPSKQEAANSMRLVVDGVATKPTPEAKTSGIKIRGTGAATRGKMARGPMA